MPIILYLAKQIQVVQLEKYQNIISSWRHFDYCNVIYNIPLYQFYQTLLNPVIVYIGLCYYLSPNYIAIK